MGFVVGGVVSCLQSRMSAVQSQRFVRTRYHVCGNIRTKLNMATISQTGTPLDRKHKQQHRGVRHLVVQHVSKLWIYSREGSHQMRLLQAHRGKKNTHRCGSHLYSET